MTVQNKSKENSKIIQILVFLRRFLSGWYYLQFLFFYEGLSGDFCGSNWLDMAFFFSFNSSKIYCLIDEFVPLASWAALALVFLTWVELLSWCLLYFFYWETLGGDLTIGTLLWYTLAAFGWGGSGCCRAFYFLLRLFFCCC